MGAFAGAMGGVADTLRAQVERQHQANLMGMQIKQQNVQLQHQTNLEMSNIAAHLGDASEDEDVKSLYRQFGLDILAGKNKRTLEDVTKQAVQIHQLNQARKKAQAQAQFYNPQTSPPGSAQAPPPANLPGPSAGTAPPQVGPTGAAAVSPPAAAPPAPSAMNQPGGGMSASGGGAALATPPNQAAGPQFEPVQFPEQPLYPGEEYKARLQLAQAAQQRQDAAKIDFAAYKAKRDYALGYAKQLMGQGTRHFMEGIDAQGNPTFRADQGRWVPGFVYGSDDPDAPDREKIYRVKEYTDGTKEYVAEKGRPLSTVVRDQSSPLGAWKNIYAQNGEFVSRVAVEPPAALQPTVTSRTGEQVTEVYNPATGQVEKRKVPVSATTIRTKGGAGAGATIPAPPSTTPPALTAPPGKSLGPAPSQVRREQENPLIPAAQSVVIQTRPTAELIRKAQSYIKAQGWDKDPTPMTTFLPRLSYAMGYGSDQGGFLGALNMDQIISAGSILRTSGGMRAIQALKLAMVHTPDAWKDSGKLMYDKLGAIADRLETIERVAREEGQRYPGMKRGGASLPAPPTNRPPLESFGR